MRAMLLFRAKQNASSETLPTMKVPISGNIETRTVASALSQQKSRIGIFG